MARALVLREGHYWDRPAGEGRRAPLGSSRLLSAPLGSSRLLPAPLNSSPLAQVPIDDDTKFSVSDYRDRLYKDVG